MPYTSKISTRISLRWLPGEASEPTDTLVFGVGGYFIDLRVCKDSNEIDWALAGERVVISKDPLKCRWIKTLDSLGLTEPDEGSFTTLPNGDSLETGSMPCPGRSMAVTEYEEVWRVLPPVPGPKRAWILESVDDGGYKTFLGRIGGGYLSMHKGKGGAFGARSEEWDEERKGWKIRHAVGELEDLKSPKSFGIDEMEEEKDWKLGQKIEMLGREYWIRAWEEWE